MEELFRIETDLLTLVWNKPSGKEPPALAGHPSPSGRLSIRKRRHGLLFENTWRAYVPEVVAADPEQIVGPRLYEQVDYHVYLHSKSEARVMLQHRDPVIRRDLHEYEGGRSLYGRINFGSEIGNSEFSVLVNGKPEFSFEVEVFPTKLDYASDYKEILAEVQGIVTGLALEYLRSTFQEGVRSHVPEPTRLEWLTLLRCVADELERALQHIAQRPIRTLTREPTIVRADKIKHVDSSVRSAILRRAGLGAMTVVNGGLTIRRHLEERRAKPTLDTPEHRWLSAQLNRIRCRLSELRHQEAALEKSERRAQVLRELDHLEARIVRLSRLEPIAYAVGDPPAGFASLQLLGAPGYREAYRYCLTLLLGLRIEGGPMHLSVKDLDLLYEYWCYLALLRLTSEEVGRPIPLKDLFAVRQQGLCVLLQRGRQSTIPFDASAGRKVTVTYNPRFQGESILIPQQPDVVITFEDANWSKLHLILDAKYRVDASEEYQNQYASPGPPQDALNVLHRYRDAILEQNGAACPKERPKRTVVQAAAAFPYRERETNAFQDSKLWQSLNQIGVGAIPLLPGNTNYLREWLRSALHQGGWAFADRAIAHRARDLVQDWRVAASEPVLVGTLRDGNEQQHLDWIRETRFYYMPLLKTQVRQYATKWVAIYSPESLRKTGAVTHYAPVESVVVVSRRDIDTPWIPRRNPDELQVLYKLGSVREMDLPVENRNVKGAGQRFSVHRWTSRLALRRARVIEELFMETEPEWRLYEDLNAAGLAFDLEPRWATLPDAADPAGRVWFITGMGLRIRYAGASGFVTKQPGSDEKALLHLEEVIEMARKITEGGETAATMRP